MRIGIAGSHGTGKSVLAKKLADTLELPLIEEVARNIAKKMQLEQLDPLFENKQLALEFQSNVLANQIAEEIKHINGFVSDRTVIDNYAYWSIYGLCNYINLSRIYEKVIAHAETGYDVIFFLPIEFPVENDGFRFQCEQCRNLVEGLIMHTLIQLQSVPVVILRGDLDSRLKQAVTFVEQIEK
jgi:nicotinamide riboside kinase